MSILAELRSCFRRARIAQIPLSPTSGFQFFRDNQSGKLAPRNIAEIIVFVIVVVIVIEKDL